tara:strand:- start:984 stop:2636 length:1653 start_codon:yes stop_codon:yes gene_type:complete
MAEILSNSFKTDVTRLFIDDLVTNDYWLFVSGIDSFTPTDSVKSKREFLEKTLFAKRVIESDIHFMIKYYPWQVGSVYIEYDDTTDLTGKKFYAVVGPNDNDTGDYRVYKCLNNNSGATASTPPNYDATNTNQVYSTADGYVWKYMYVISSLEFDAYNAIGYVPITPTPVPNNPIATTASTVSDIIVTNQVDNYGYVVESGAFALTPFSSGTIIVEPSTTFSPITNYYTGQYLYATNPSNGVSRLWQITYYAYNITTGNAELRVGAELLTGAASPDISGVASNANFKILPRVKIEGDGSGAIGIPTIVNNRITKITVLSEGSNYTNATASIVDPAYGFDPEDTTTTDIRALIRPRLSPAGGHGFNLIDEFSCKHFSLYAYISADDNTKIGDTNTYGAVGIVRTPSFDTGFTDTVVDNRIAVVTDDFSKVTANGSIIQVDSTNETVFSGRVHEVDTTANTVYIAEYLGPYTNNSATGIALHTNNQNDVPLDLTLPFRNDTGQTININTPVGSNVTLSKYTQRTGEVYFMENFFPLARTDLSREEFKFVLEF